MKPNDVFICISETCRCFYMKDKVAYRLGSCFFSLFSRLLAHIYHLSLNLGVLPDMRKTAKVKHLCKKGDKYCNVRNIDWLVVALDGPECAGEDSLAPLVNTGQPCVYKYLLFKVSAPQ